MTRREVSRYLSQPIFDLNKGICLSRKVRRKRRQACCTEAFESLVMSSLTYPYLDRKGSFLGCFEVINPYLNVVSIMNYQTKRGEKALIYSFLLQLCMMCFH